MFTWVPIYKELADALMPFRDRQGKLLSLLGSIKAKQVPMISLTERLSDGRRVPLTEIDPFTFFASFNRRTKSSNRQTILQAMKEHFRLNSPIPSDFDGIPIMHPMQSHFFPFKGQRKDDDIKALWELAAAVVSQEPSDIPGHLFDRCLSIRQVSPSNLTIGMFWMRPESYLSLDKQNKSAMKALGIPHEVKSWNEYLAFLHSARQVIEGPLYEFSRKAFEGGTAGDGETRGYWIFQANPKLFDLVGALKADAIHTWTVSQHKNRIRPGDKAIIWATGADAGCYALATVASEVEEMDTPQSDDTYWVKPPARDQWTGVEIEVEVNLADCPINRKELTSDPIFSDFNAGSQGTNLAATKQQYEALLAKTAGRSGRRYWLIAPGPGAKHWEEWWDGGLAAIGWDELPDPSTYPTRKALQRAIMKIKKLEKRASNQSLAVWQFVHEIKPGDILIPKRGKSHYLGYGIVTSRHRYDADRDSYRNLMDVDWRKRGEWLDDVHPIALKTLTEVINAPYIDRLTKLIGIETDETSDTQRAKLRDLPLNLILYGPPGTGKTYTLQNAYFDRFTDRSTPLTPEQYARQLIADKTWWQVVTAVLIDLRQAKVRDIEAHPLMQAKIKGSSTRTPGNSIWAHLQAHTRLDCANVKYDRRAEPLLFSKSADSVWSVDLKTAQAEVPELVAISKQLATYDPKPATIKRYEFTTFHQSFSYEDFIEGIKPVMGESEGEEGHLAYETKPGIFKQLVARAKEEPDKPFALFIDEINRGNIASIFGELITLIESDKRLGAANELTTILPYSREVFGVPRNIHIIGTMNTADRSVEALDTALRRRFSFKEVRPDASLVKTPTGFEVDLARLLTTINSRIERLLDRDHQIGHSFLMGIEKAGNPLAALRAAFKDEILPLLQEFFYGDPAKIGMVLGERFVSKETNPTEFANGDWGAEEFETHDVYKFADVATLTEPDFIAIYE